MAWLTKEPLSTGMEKGRGAGAGHARHPHGTRAGTRARGHGPEHTHRKPTDPRPYVPAHTPGTPANPEVLTFTVIPDELQLPFSL